MIDRYEQFTGSISCIYKTVQKIKRDEMNKHGLKGPHAQCLLTMNRCPDGIIISQLCEICELDKAAISRAVSELEEKGMIEGRHTGDKLYRAPLRLTEEGKRVATDISGIAERAVELAGQGLTDENRQIFYASLDLIAGNLLRISREGIPSTIDKGNNNHEE